MKQKLHNALLLTLLGFVIFVVASYMPERDEKDTDFPVQTPVKGECVYKQNNEIHQWEGTLVGNIVYIEARG
jgi:hypothetical protein